ncbi:hypothetical protein EJ05DRAFT_475377 [Pseudovirgaria hyperparasitica]|uniref:Uncharacterized protein n=1 Tax=Pseudovirgaria hyperparasitica TaxID=470096 RepID=A0A6A6W919_9PEZI|nr:uncharacterized protein EJ05DRAFT_475377 [Pseudovirgaria hyperparasitica]KAF2759153.1 hypothetical protein EJ05DRAFT_475377 [Pseudovirgaria hyperparasitica]
MASYDLHHPKPEFSDSCSPVPLSHQGKQILYLFPTDAVLFMGLSYLYPWTSPAMLFFGALSLC